MSDIDLTFVRMIKCILLFINVAFPCDSQFGDIIKNKKQRLFVRKYKNLFCSQIYFRVQKRTVYQECNGGGVCTCDKTDVFCTRRWISGKNELFLFKHEVLFFKLAFPFPLLNFSRYLPTGKRFPVIFAIVEIFKSSTTAQITGNEISGPLIGWDSYSHYFFIFHTNFLILNIVFLFSLIFD
jgi:hypothetical protein